MNSALAHLMDEVEAERWMYAELATISCAYEQECHEQQRELSEVADIPLSTEDKHWAYKNARRSIKGLRYLPNWQAALLVLGL